VPLVRSDRRRVRAVRFAPQTIRETSVNELLQSDGLMRRLRRGAPLELEAERVRLPRFTEIREFEQKEFGQKGKEPIVVARSRTATWALWPIAKKSPFEVRDAERFLSLVASVGGHVVSNVLEAAV
jgi:hypothetical protein